MLSLDRHGHLLPRSGMLIESFRSQRSSISGRSCPHQGLYDAGASFACDRTEQNRDIYVV